MPLVFTYGPDTLQSRMYDRIGSTEVIGTGTLEGYALVFDKPNMKNKAEGLPNLRPDDGGRTFGLLFELTPKQFEALDGFYGGYERKILDVVVNDPENPITRPARMWLARRTKPGLMASEANIEVTRKGLEENEAPEQFIDALNSYEVLEMKDMQELIVGFRHGFAESDARAAVEAAGGSVRRRMRTDSAEEVMLLVRVKDAAALEKTMKANEEVTHTEINSNDFSI